MGEEEFFANRDVEVATKAGTQRKIAILALEHRNPRLWRDYRSSLRLVESTNAFYRGSGRFPLTGTGKLNTYPLFAETITRIIHLDGRAGFIVPTGIATDDTTKDFFASVVSERRLAKLISLFEIRAWFPATDDRKAFCLLTIGEAPVTRFIFDVKSIADLKLEQKWIELPADDLLLINPNTRTCPLFRSRADAELTKRIYRRVRVLVTEARGDRPEQNPWGVSFSQGLFNMTSASDLFLDAPTSTSLPLYEAKMIHQFDHRWATYRWDAGEGEPVTDDVSDSQKARADFVVQPRYWVEERHVLSRLAAVPHCVTKAWEEQSEDALRNAFAIWIASALGEDALAELRGQAASARQRVIDAGGQLFATLPATESDWFNGKAAAEARDWPALNPDELTCLRESPSLLNAAHTILDRRSPRWLMGWRDICRSTDLRTVIASVIPRVAVGDKFLLMFTSIPDRRLNACLLADQNSLTHDFVARQKLGGTSLKYYTKKQIPNIPPAGYTPADLAYIVPRVLELTYASHDLKPWAEDLGYAGPPFVYDPARRAIMRAELDAWYARLYGLTRDELRYILDPSDTHGPDYPTETFRGLKTNEMRAHGEYRTRRLVLEAWDAQNR